MYERKVWLYVCAAATLVACPLHTPVPVEPDAPAAEYPEDGGSVPEEPEGSAAALSSPCGKACQTFARLGCPEAKASDNGISCYRVCTKAASLRKIPAACWASAPTVEALRACGGVRCVP